MGWLAALCLVLAAAGAAGPGHAADAQEVAAIGTRRFLALAHDDPPWSVRRQAGSLPPHQRSVYQ